MFNRVFALDSFVLLACSVVSVFLLYRVIALMETIPTNYRLCVFENELKLLFFLSVTHQGEDLVRIELMLVTQ